MNLSKSGAQIWIPGGTPARGTRGERAAGGAVHVAPEEPRKCGKSRISAVLVWNRAPRFDTRLRTFVLVPSFAYKYPGIFRAWGGGVFEKFLGSSSPYCSFRVVSSS